MRYRILAVMSALLTAAVPLLAQSAREQIALGDRAYADRRIDAAITAYVTALRAEPKNYEALWKTARSTMDRGVSLSKGEPQDSAFTLAERYATAAVRANPRDAQGHYLLARVMGVRSMGTSVMTRIRYGKVVRAEALEAMRYDSLHPGALHVMGMWNAEVMRVNGASRAFARSFLGADVFALASWAEATRYLERAVAVDGDRIVHHLDLAAVYADQGLTAKAREQYLWITRAPEREPNDAAFKRRAADRLRKP